jgi:hypothetical protein
MIKKDWMEINGGKTADEVVAWNEKTVDIDL